MVNQPSNKNLAAFSLTRGFHIFFNELSKLSMKEQPKPSLVQEKLTLEHLNTLRTSAESLKNRIGILEFELSTELWSEQEEKEKEAIINKLHRQLKRLNQSLVLSDTDQGKSKEQILKTVQKLIANAKKFKENDRGDDYWTMFKNICTSNSLGDREAVYLLAPLMSEHPFGSIWYQNCVEPQRDSISLEQVKLLFYEQFLSKFWKEERFQELIDLSYRKSEDVRHFTNRFMAKAVENEIKWAEPCPETTFANKLLFFKSPPSVQRIIGDRPLSSFKTPQELAELLTTFSGIPTDVPRKIFTCPECSGLIEWSCGSGCASGQKGSKHKSPGLAKSNTFFCKRHGSNSSHSTDKCLSNNPQGEAESKKRKIEDRIGPKGTTRPCKWCKKEWAQGHTCKEYFEAKDRKKVKTDPADNSAPSFHNIKLADPYQSESELSIGSLSFEDWEDQDVTISTITMPGKRSDSFVYAPITIQGIKVMAGVDSMASHSILTPELAKALRAQITPLEGKVILGERNATVPRVGRTSPLEVRAGNSLVKHEFEILALGATCNCILGIDIMAKLGIAITGVPSEFPQEAEPSKVRKKPEED